LSTNTNIFIHNFTIFWTHVLRNESDSAKDGYAAKYSREPSAGIIMKTAMEKPGN